MEGRRKKRWIYIIRNRMINGRMGRKLGRGIKGREKDRFKRIDR